MGFVVAALASVTASAQSPPDPVVGTSESPLLAGLREAERQGDPSRDPAAATVAQAAARDGTTVGGRDGLDPALAGRLQMPALPMRMTPRLARALGLYRRDTRARRALVSWLRRAGRYQGRVQHILADQSLPTSLYWVVAAESNFDPRIESSAGAAGLWQLVPDTARGCGLRVDAWVDERRDPERSSVAAARYLRELHDRFGTWELALAAYNMGYGALLRAIRKYSANDFETLASLEAGLPWETVHYVPRILGLAIAAQNEAAFALDPYTPDTAVQWDDVPLTRSLSLSDLAREGHVPLAQLRELNPALLRPRTPPADEQRPFTLHVPPGSADALRSAATRLGSVALRTVTLRHGEDLTEIATRWGLRASNLLAQSGLSDERSLRPGVELLVPDREPLPATANVGTTESPASRVVPVDPTLRETAVTPGRSRVFLRVAHADDPAAVARALGVTRSELVRWNGLDGSARLQPGMWLWADVRSDPSPTARVWREGEVELLDRSSELFHDRSVAASGLVRARVTVRDGDTMDSVARRYGVTVGSIARINHRDRRAALTPGETVVVYTAASRMAEGDPTVTAPPAPVAHPGDAVEGGAPPVNTDGVEFIPDPPRPR